MYDLVNDVESYPEFLPWCGAAVVHEATETRLRASIEMRKGPLHYRLTTVNTMIPNERIDVELVQGPFRHLNGYWLFRADGETGAGIEFDLNFQFRNRLIEAALGRLFHEITDTLVEAFCTRAHEIYSS